MANNPNFVGFSVTEPFSNFTDNYGQPLMTGKVYIGEPNRDPTKFPLPVFWDSSCTIPAPQPIYVLYGSAQRNGSDGTIYVTQDYSLSIFSTDSNGNDSIISYVASSPIAGISDIYSFFADSTTPDSGAGAIGYSDTTVYTVGVGSALRDRPVVLNSVAEIRLLTKKNPPTCVVIGYYSGGDGGGPGIISYDSTDTTSPDDGVLTFVGIDGSRWKRIFRDSITTKQSGCKADGVTDDTTSINRWFSAGISSGAEMVISPGTHLVTTPLTFDFTSVGTKGALLRGTGTGRSILKTTATTGKPFYFIGGAKYVRLESCSFTGVYNGVLATFSDDGLTSFLDGWSIEDDVLFSNGSVGISMETVRINGATSCSFNFTAIGGGSGQPGSPTAPGFGNAVTIRGCSSCLFDKLKVSNALYGVRIPNIVGSTTKVSGNVFNSPNISGVNYGVSIETAMAENNNIIGGTIAATNIFNATAGYSNSATNVNCTLYSGGSFFNNSNVIGFRFIGNPPINILPSFIPISVTALPFVNVTGRVLEANVVFNNSGSYTINRVSGPTQTTIIGTTPLPISKYIRLQPGDSFSSLVGLPNFSLNYVE